MTETARILIVDDDRRMTRTLADILALAGYETEESSSGAEALQKAREKDFDCVLSDVRMPEMNGVELYRALREIQPGLPMILMTAYASEDLIRGGLDDGVIGALEKPLDINGLLEFLSSMRKNRMIVVVDDDPDFCATLKAILEKRGFRVSIVTDPHQPPEQMAHGAQALLLDMKLNNISGEDALREIRKRYPALPVILVTGYREEMSAAIENAMKIDAFACLYKPLEIPRLLQMLADLQLSRLRRLLKNPA